MDAINRNAIRIELSQIFSIYMVATPKLDKPESGFSSEIILLLVKWEWEWKSNFMRCVNNKLAEIGA